MRSRLVVAGAGVVVVRAVVFFGYDVFCQGADRVETGFVRGGEKVLEGRQHVAAELGLADGREAPVGAERLHEPLNGGKR